MCLTQNHVDTKEKGTTTSFPILPIEGTSLEEKANQDTDKILCKSDGKPDCVVPLPPLKTGRLVWVMRLTVFIKGSLPLLVGLLMETFRGGNWQLIHCH